MPAAGEEHIALPPLAGSVHFLNGLHQRIERPRNVEVSERFLRPHHAHDPLAHGSTSAELGIVPPHPGKGSGSLDLFARGPALFTQDDFIRPRQTVRHQLTEPVNKSD